VQTLVAADKLELAYGGQDVSAHDSGAYTGEISGQFLAKLDCAYVIIGHSERRTLHNETDEEIGAKVAAAIKHGVVPVLCVGETAEDLEKFGPSAVPVAQLKAALAGVASGVNIVVAYEPVWAIGSGQAATPDQAEQVCAALRAELAETLGAHAHPLRRFGEVGQHRGLHARAERRRRPRRRREPRPRRIQRDRALQEARRSVATLVFRGATVYSDVVVRGADRLPSCVKGNRCKSFRSSCRFCSA
jgi:hypothetical protein